MKKATLLVLILVILGGSIQAKKQKKITTNSISTTSICLGTYNIRGDMPDGINCWTNRRDSLCKLVKRAQLDIVGMQEVMDNQLDDILSRTDYQWVGMRGTMDPILFNATKYELLHAELFWISETMKPFSKGWDGKYDRYCQWAKFKERKTQKEFYVFNTHLDHKGEVARREGAKVILAQIEKYAKDAPVFVVGDMNSKDDTGAYQSFTTKLKDAKALAKEKKGPEGTAHNFGKVSPVRIDYVFVNQAVTVKSYTVDDESYPNGFYPSDHYLVFVKAEF